ncbi:hypothetical protein AVDCRST_MAG92-285 [uncultured Coleofasciculus sp.]|uniref:Uncharacterized protein n=1 Tax=uncultured Coleofasciculus sp. TaxID=1267456 RepID=A0A6J4H5P5_9CYAN|nr:hypothetical protein AVDCRST_MAG92-285 [uncultured Coleofasciculus sp.]
MEFHPKSDRIYREQSLLFRSNETHRMEALPLIFIAVSHKKAINLLTDGVYT